MNSSRAAWDSRLGAPPKWALCFNHMAPSCLSQGVVLGAHPDAPVLLLNFILSKLQNQKGIFFFGLTTWQVVVKDPSANTEDTGYP